MATFCLGWGMQAIASLAPSRGRFSHKAIALVQKLWQNLPLQGVKPPTNPPI
ncbi:hypothetical protein [Leptolyngbya sp. FACHB-671]|uniref:hypothetical protein n=1 Tax=Leptolyngbya sp. FACHB-671 TaxID=2692812 RepID=UPI0016884F6E|nr:hypothetical protein [Leptolyngbya sp. FACHB-671]